MQRLSQSVLQQIALAGPFAEIDLGAFTLVFVVEVLVVEIPSHWVVVVLVHDAEVLLGGMLPSVFVVAAFPEGSHCAHYGDLGMRLLHTLVEVVETLVEHIAQQILVADAQVLQIEGFRVSGLGTHGGQLAGGGIAVGPLDEIEQLLQIGGHRQRLSVVGVAAGFPGNAALLSVSAATAVLTGHTGRKHGQRLCTDVFTELEIFVETQTACLVVVPDVEVRLTLPQLTHCGLPVVDVVNAVAVAHAAAGEAHELRTQVRQLLGQIPAQTVFTTLVGVHGEEAHHVEVILSGFDGFHNETPVGGTAGDLQHGFLLCPFRAGAECGHCECCPFLIRQAHFHLALASQEHGEAVFFTVFQSDSVPTLVRQLGAGSLHLQM